MDESGRVDLRIISVRRQNTLAQIIQHHHARGSAQSVPGSWTTSKTMVSKMAESCLEYAGMAEETPRIKLFLAGAGESARTVLVEPSQWNYLRTTHSNPLFRLRLRLSQSN